MTTFGLGIKDSKRPEDYKHYYHTDNSGNIWVDGEGIPFVSAIPLQGHHFDMVSPEILQIGRQTRNQIDTDVPIPTFPTNNTCQ